MKISDLPDPFPLPVRPSAFPRLAQVRVTFPRPRVADVPAAVREHLARLPLPTLAGRRIAITAGSRGIGDIVPALATVVAVLRERGAVPVVVAAMGSHGGATGEGQRRLLSHLGITPDSVGAPIVSDMDAIELGRTPQGLIAYCDRHAAGCDAILVVNRVKPHTAFAEPFGSGLLKMLAVGLGKAPGAAQIHRQGLRQMAAAIEAIAGVVLASGKVLGGLAIVENAYDETATIVAVPASDIPRVERELFQQARSLLPHLPVDELDVLIVDEIGKNFSGTGMDVYVIGRWRLPEMPEPASPRIKRIAALRLSPASDGNAQGVGLADVVTRRLVEAIDPVTTYVNNLVSTFLPRAFIPVTMPNDRDAISAALASLALPDAPAARMARIHNTLHLDEIWLSESVLPEVEGRPDIAIGALEELRFTAEGWLADLIREPGTGNGEP